MKKIYIVMFLAATLFCVVFFLQKKLAIVLKEAAAGELGKIINTRADIDSLDVNLFKGIVYFSGLKAENPPGFHERYFADIKKGYVDVSLRSLLFGDIRIERIFLDRPIVNMEINKESVSNTRLIFRKKTPANKAAAATPRPQKDSSGFGINEIDIKNGVFKFVNYKVNQNGAEVLFDEIDILVKNLRDSEGPGDFPTSIKCSAALPAGGLTGRLELSARGNLLSDLIDFDLSLKAGSISLPYFMPFYVNTAPILARRGWVNLDSAAECRKNRLHADQKVSIRDLEVVTSRENIGDNAIFGLPAMTVTNFFMNNQGTLDFDFEITGALSDPEFHIMEALKGVLARSIGNVILNRLSQFPSAVFEKAKEGGNIEDAGKEVLKDVLQKILAPDKERQE